MGRSVALGCVVLAVLVTACPPAPAVCTPSLRNSTTAFRTFVDTSLVVSAELSLQSCGAREVKAFATVTDSAGARRSDALTSVNVTDVVNELVTVNIAVQPDLAGQWRIELQLDSPVVRLPLTFDVIAVGNADAGLITERLPYDASECLKLRRTSTGLTVCDHNTDSMVDVFRDGTRIAQLDGDLLAVHRTWLWLRHTSPSSIELRSAADDALPRVGITNVSTTTQLAGLFEDRVVVRSGSATTVFDVDAGSFIGFERGDVPGRFLWVENGWWDLLTQALCSPIGECTNLPSDVAGYDGKSLWLPSVVPQSNIFRFSPIDVTTTATPFQPSAGLALMTSRFGLIEGTRQPYFAGQVGTDVRTINLALRTTPEPYFVALPEGSVVSTEGDFWVVINGRNAYFLPAVGPPFP